MVWPKPKHTRSQVHKAGKIIVKSAKNLTDVDEFFRALDVLTNWRASHAYPVNTFQATLRKNAHLVDKDSLVAQRLKRTPSIVQKLSRYPSMSLSTMQDIGGLRAVVSNIESVRKLEKLYAESHFKHHLISKDDYIDHPKESGYRGIHLIYKYLNQSAPEYNNLLVELQFRTRLQHTWATTVETIGTVLGKALKSSEGPEQFLEFFSLTGSAFAYIENTALVPQFSTLSKQETFEKVIAQSNTFKSKLQAIKVATQAIKGRGSYYLLSLDLDRRVIAINSYARKNLDEASRKYAELEKQIEDGANKQAVLVSADSIYSLKKAYPNYFLDTNEFINTLGIIERSVKKNA